MTGNGVNEGQEMHALARKLFPICRSITGEGIRETLNILNQELPNLSIYSVPSGTNAFDWTVPDEWTIRSAHLIDPDGEKVIDFANNNLHLVGYSEPVSCTIALEDLQKHLYSLPNQPKAIPYVTSYYRRRWGFCLSHDQRAELKDGYYRVEIDSDIRPGHLNYAELLIPGDTEKEIFLSTYVCHPSMANNELSGPLVTTWLSKYIMSKPRRYSYRIVFIPETIGSLVYLASHLDEMKANIVAGFNVTCVGDERCYSYVPSRLGASLSDRVAKHVLEHIDPDYKSYSYLDRGSDERQYCAPGVDLPVATITRSKYHEYPEYHTSLDNLDLITPQGLQGSLEALQHCIEVLEANRKWRMTVKGEPQLGKRGLYPTLSVHDGIPPAQILMNLIAYCDGEHDLLEIGEIIGVAAWRLIPLIDTLVKEGLLEESS